MSNRKEALRRVRAVADLVKRGDEHVEKLNFAVFAYRGQLSSEEAFAVTEYLRHVHDMRPRAPAIDRLLEGLDIIEELCGLVVTGPTGELDEVLQRLERHRKAARDALAEYNRKPWWDPASLVRPRRASRRVVRRSRQTAPKEK